MGVASGGCQGRGETGAGAAAAVATGKEGSGEGGVGEGGRHTRGGVVREDRVKKRVIENKQVKVTKKNRGERRKKVKGSGSCAWKNSGPREMGQREKVNETKSTQRAQQ